MVKFAKDAGEARTRREQMGSDEQASPDNLKKASNWTLQNGTLKFGAPPISYEIMRGDGISKDELPQSANVQLYMSMDGSGGTVEDHSGNNLDGSIDGDASRASDLYENKFDGVSFNGSGGVSGFGGLGSPPSEYTVSMLIIPSSAPSDREFIWDLGADWSLAFDDTTDEMGVLQVEDDGTSKKFRFTRPPEGVPTLITTRWGGSNTYIDHNDHLKISGRSIASLSSRSADSRLGRIGDWSSASPSYWTGDMLLFVVWDSFLSDSEVKSLAHKLGLGRPWEPSKDASNPLVAAGSQSYPPSVIKGADGNYYMTIKSSGDIIVFSSSDGVSWTQENTLSLRSNDNHEQTVLRYDINKDNYKLYVDNRTNDNLLFYTSDSPTTGYSEHPNSPLLDSHSVDGTTYSEYKVCDHIIHDGTHYVYYYTGSLGSGDPFTLQVASGPSWTELSFDSILLEASNMPEARPVLQGPTVFQDEFDEFRYVFTAGDSLSSDGERALYAGWGESPTEFRVTRSPMLYTGKPDSWSDRRVYNAQWLKKQDGEYKKPLKPDGDYWLYYSGHDDDGDNNGYTGLARYSELPRARDMEGI